MDLKLWYFILGTNYLRKDSTNLLHFVCFLKSVLMLNSVNIFCLSI